jgi:hypothetical protein
MRLKKFLTALAMSVIGIGTAIPLAIPAHADQWDERRAMYTKDGDGFLQWDSNSGVVRVCDIAPGGWEVRAWITRENNSNDVIRARLDRYTFDRGGSDNCEEHGMKKIDKDYNRNQVYHFKLCQARGEEEKSCREADSDWGVFSGKIPSPDDPYWNPLGNCAALKKGSLQDKCIKNSKKKEGCDNYPAEFKDLCKDAVGPKGERYLNTDKPEVMLPPTSGPSSGPPSIPWEYDHAAVPRGIAEPMSELLRIVKWFVFGGCVAGFMIVGGRMAVKHQRGEAGAHATGLAWVMIACIVGGSSLATGLIALLVDPHF